MLLPILVQTAGYALLAMGAFAIDLRLGAIVVGIALLIEGRDASDGA